MLWAAKKHQDLPSDWRHVVIRGLQLDDPHWWIPQTQPILLAFF